MGNDRDSSKDESKQDASSPYFIHHSNHPGMVIVSKPLNGDNYATWCRSMEISLSAKNKLGFIDGTVEPLSTKNNPNEFYLWRRCNDMILSWILNSLTSDIADSVIYSTTAYEIWQDLKERFSQGNAPRIFQLHSEISSLTQGQMYVANYYTKIKALWDELGSYNDLPACSCGAMKKHMEQEERNALMQFLMGLNESYSAVRGQILLMQPLTYVRKAYSLISQEEKQRELESSHTEPAAMAVHHKPQSSNPGCKHLHCSYCDVDHHTRDTCWKLNGYPPGHRLHKSNKPGGGRNKRNGGSSSALHVSAHPSIPEIQTAMPNLSKSQCQQVYTMLNEQQTPQANAAGSSSGLGYEDDDWVG